MEEPKFVVDFMLGRLAKWLRIWGYDAEYYHNIDRHEILYRSLQNKRVILTRDRTLSKKRAWKLVFIKSDFLEDQIEQVKNGFDLNFSKERLFTRCSICNVHILPIDDKNRIKDKVPPYVYTTHNEFSYCPKCERVYWPGTHLDLVLQRAHLGKFLK